MLISAWLTAVRNRLSQTRSPLKRRNVVRTEARLEESLETRALLAGPSLVAVRPNIGAFLNPGETRNVAPRELTLQFNPGQQIDSSNDRLFSNSPIEVTRSGRDGTFGDGNEVAVTLGYVGLGATAEDVVIRFAENLPDDYYRITIKGSGTNPLQNVNSETFVSGNSNPDGTFDFRLNLAAQVRAVVPQPIIRNTDGSLTQQRDRIVVYFNEDTLDTASAQNPNFYRLLFSRGTTENTDDVLHLPTSVVYSAATNTSTLTFSAPIDQLSGSGTYRLRIGTDEAIPLAPTSTTFSEVFTSNFGTSGAGLANVTIEPIVSIDGQPIRLFFQESALGAAGTPTISVSANKRDITITLDTVGGTTASQLYWGLRIHPDASKVVQVRISGNPDSSLVTGTLPASFSFADPGSSYTNSFSLGTLTAQSRIISGQILSRAYPFDFPGNSDEPGHRETDVPRESHLEVPLDQNPEISTIYYNFQRIYGVNPQGQPLANLITENQKQRAREVFDLYARHLGVQFVETSNQGFTIVTGDMRAIDPSIITGAGGVTGYSSRSMNLAIMDNAETWNDSFGGSWFTTAMHEIGHLLGLGHAYELPELTVMGGFEGPTVQTTIVEPDFPGDADIVHGQALYRPESRDIDLYSFVLTNAGQFTAETIAERLSNSSLLDTVVRLYRQNADGTRSLISQNDDYFSEDSLISMDLEAGTYFLGVSASGNDAYDPSINDNGMNGTTQGRYELRVAFRPNAANSIIDSALNQPSQRFDGDHDGVAGGVFNYWFRAVDASRLRVVDKLNIASPGITNRYTTIAAAFIAAQPGDVVRIVGNGGADGDAATKVDNIAYQIGLDDSGFALVDGSTMDVPLDVAVMIEAGTIIKFQDSLIGVGSSSVTEDRGGATLQVLGTPFQDVTLTSWRDETIAGDTTPTPTVPRPGNWGGIVFRRDVDNFAGSINYERQGQFLDYVAYASMSYGGGKLLVDSVEQIVNPITLVEARPSIYNNFITLSEDSAMSADPDSFEESTFSAPAFQAVPFTPDYGRVGPDIYGNRLINNSNNGLFVRIQTEPGAPTKEMTVAGRFDDKDIVHIVSENLSIKGTPGGPFLEVNAPPVVLVTVTPQSSGGTLAVGTYNYRIVYVDSSGNQSPPSLVTRSASVTVANSRITLGNLPPATSPYTSRRIYRSTDTGAGPYRLIANLNSSSTSYIDNGTTLTGLLDETLVGRNRAQFDASLVVDPELIIKLEGSRIEVGMGAQVVIESQPGREVILTSRLDDRYGIGGTFDTNNDDRLGTGEGVPSRTAGTGLWGGLHLRPGSTASLDYTLVTFGGSVIPTDGNFAGFNVVEAHQADLRIANSIFEENRDGTGGTSPASRFGRTSNASGTIFARGSQPVIINNIFRDNTGPVLSINANAMTTAYLADYGRVRGPLGAFSGYEHNQGPLIDRNLQGRNLINGLVVRGETLTTQTVWDDTDTVHVLLNEIVIPNFHTYGGLRLNSDPDASLVVKLSGAGAGFTAAGKPLDINDRIGGILQIVGQPYFPVILTALADDSVGAGFDLAGLPLRDTNGNGASTGSPGAWRSLRISEYAHDRNVEVYNEREVVTVTPPGTNATARLAEFIGDLGRQNFRVINPDGTTTTQKASDDNLRLGFEVHGTINAPSDVDVYSFTATAGSEVWIDVDRTTHSLDAVVELISSIGSIIALSDSSLDESLGAYPVFRNSTLLQANTLNKSQYISDDLYTTNQKDPGFRVILPGTVGTTGTYQVRVRSSNIDSLNPAAVRGNLTDPTKIYNGITSGSYQLQIRLQEIDEVPGTSVRYADIRFATNGIEVFGQPAHSPLSGEYAESLTPNDTAQSSGQQNIGNVLNKDRAAASIAGRIDAPTDVDFYRFSVTWDDIQQITGHTNPLRFASVVFDVDYADGMSRGNLQAHVYDARTNELILTARDSNIADDQGGPLEGADMDDLSRGSVGKLDPYIGPFELPEGDYYLVVAPNSMLPAVLNQTLVANPVSTLIRLEPLPSISRIFDEHFGGIGTSNAPLYQFADGEQGQNQVRYHLGDVTLFTGDGTNIYTANSFTGSLTTQLNAGGIGSHNEIQMRQDGELYTWVTNSATDAGSAIYTLLNTGSGAPTAIGDDGIQTFHFDAGNVANSNVGTVVTAFTYVAPVTDGGIMVVQRGDGVSRGYSRNILYQFNVRTGAAISQGPLRTGNARAGGPAGTDVVELAVLPTQNNGIISGIAVNANQLFAVDNTGRLYHYVVTPLGVTVANVRRYRVDPTDPNSAFVNFTGLVNGPNVVENGAYATTLFASDNLGNIYALAAFADPLAGTAFGDEMPFFYDGQSRVPVGATNVGITFGTLQRNIWALSGDRAGDNGHGLNIAIDGTRSGAPGGSTLYFGNQAGGPLAGNKNDLGNQGRVLNYNFPGGAHGTFLSNPFSLEGYTASDKPTLYFNYFLQTDSNDYQPGVRPHSDAMRVYVGDGTNWVLATTNDSFRGPLLGDDEQDLGPNGVTQYPTTQALPDVVELFDEGASAWRQARVDLSNFAGRSDLRLRFEFASSGAVNVGDILTVGEEMYARRGSVLRDGQSFILEGCNQFEVDLGYTLIIPTYEQISEGETFEIEVTDPLTGVPESYVFEFDKAGDGVGGTNQLVRITAGMGVSEITRILENAILSAAQGTTGSFAQLRPHRNDNRLNLTRHPDGEPIATDGIVLTPSGTGILIEGAPGVTPGTTPVTIHSTMTANEVAESISVALASNLLPAGTYDEAELNNVADPFIAMDLEALAWSSVANNTISLNDPTPLPHITILGSSTVATGTDFYRFVVPDLGTGPLRVIVDLDGTASTFNSMLRLVDGAGNTIKENINGGILDIGSNFSTASYIDELLAPGEYYVQVGVPPFLSGAAPGQVYTLHLSVEGHSFDDATAVPLVVDRFNIKGSADLVRIIGHYVTNPGPMGHTTSLPGDGFGGYSASVPSLRGMNNTFEGIHIDDIIIGFAERGEMVTGAPNNTQFIPNPEVVNTDAFNPNPYQDILVGAYDVEIRRAADYATFVDGSPLPNPPFRMYDTNDRLTEQQSIRVPSAAELRDGQTFSISDGVSTVTFEYEDENISDGVSPGHQPILFNPSVVATIDPRFETVEHRTSEPAAIIAARIRDAINSTQVQGLLNLRAALSDGAEDSSILSNSAVVNLFGTSFITLTNPETLLNTAQATPGGDAMPLGIFGRLAPLGNTSGSSTLFTFRNTTPRIDPNNGFPEQIRSIRIQLPAGLTFDPISILGGGGNGPTVNPVSDFDTPTFTTLDASNPRVPQFSFTPNFDTIIIDFSSIVASSQTGPGFELGDQLVFGIDIDAFAEPIYTLSAAVEVEFSSGVIVNSLMVRGRSPADLGVLRPVEDTTNVIFHSAYGDQNLLRDQGQLQIHSNFISDSANWGIISDAASRTSSFNPPNAGVLTHAGPVRNLREPNVNRWVPGIVIANNVIVQSGTGGILFSGDVPPGLIETVGPVPVGRIINNTIVGNPSNRSGVGIQVEQNASPTLLNNIVADLATGISVDATSQTLGTVIGATLYRNNGTNANTGSLGTGTFPIVLSTTDPLFVDEARRNYYPAPLSRAIDSSIDSLTDRTGFITVRDPLGIGVSPIKTPTNDAYGQLRGDDPDVATPAAQGSNVFKDRGAIDRVDFFRPTAIFSTPLDQSPLDLNTALDAVWLNTPGTVRELIITLRDVGIGVDDPRVFLDGSQFKLYMDDGVKQASDLPDLPDGTIITEGLLTLGVDYVFVYNSVSNEVIFRSITSFPFERKYRVTVDNTDATADGVDGIRDLAGNYLAPNRADGTTQFTLLLTDGVNDPPVNAVPLIQTVNEDTTLLFSAADGNAISVSDADVWLGNNRLRVTLTAVNGTISLSRITNLTFITGDGTDDATMTFEGAVDMINLALEGMSFLATADYFGPASITITTNDLGGFTGPPTPPAAPQQDTDVIPINVDPVNDAPSFTLPNTVLSSIEDQGQVTVPGFMTNAVAGPPNETESISALFDWTVEGAWSGVPLTFFSVAPAISLDPADPATFGQLTFTTARDVNGKAIVRVRLADGHPTDSLESTILTFEINVSALNDAPEITVNPLLTVIGGEVQINSNEDGPQVSTTLSNVFAPGPATALDELATQTVSWSVSNLVTVSGNLAFTSLSITPASILQYLTAPNAAGVATLDALLIDDGPSNAPDVNTSNPLPVRITVNQINDAPVAIAGPFVIDDGDNLVLDGSRSFDVDIPFFDTGLTYTWDIDGNGIFETDISDAVSGTPDKFTVSWTYLASLGVTSPSIRNIRLRVTDSSGALNNSHTTTTTLQTLIVDYGDAPASFGTNRADSGAAHTISSTLRLGSLVDAERNGVPGSLADGDDTTGTADDEDGVTFPVPLESGNVGLLNYVDIVSSGSGKVDIWLDLDANGVFDGADLLSTAGGFTVATGSNRFFFDIPAGTAFGSRVMRFRISASGGLSATGRANDGEVEDYEVNIRPLSTPVQPAIIRPIDITPTNGIRPQTSDVTPFIAWTAHTENFYYTLSIVSNASGNVVYSKSNITFNFQEVGLQQPDLSILPLANGTYTATVTPFNRINDPGTSSSYEFDVVRVNVAAPNGDIDSALPLVTWNHVLETKAYRVTVRSLNTGSIVEQAEFDTAGLAVPNQYQTTVALPIGRYQTTVMAIDQAGLFGTPSDPVSFQVRTAPVVTGPGAIVTNPRPTVTWQGVNGALNYELVLYNRTDNVLVRNISGIVGTSYTIPNDLTMGSYSVSVRAFNTFGDSSFYSDDRIFGYSPVISVASPSSRLPDNTPTFQINAVPAADRYELYVFEDFGSGAQVFSETNLRTTVFTRTIPLPIGRYRYYINAVNEAAAGSDSGDYVARSGDFRVVISERPVVVNPPATTFLTRPEFTWTVPLGAGNTPISDIWVNKIENGVGKVFLRANAVTGTSWISNADFGLGTYHVYIRTYSAVDPVSVSDYSFPKTVRVTTAPNLLGPSGRTDTTTPALTWEGVLGAQSYRVYLASLSTGGRVILDVSNINALSYTLTQPLLIGRYRYWVMARSAFGETSSWSLPKDFQVVAAPTVSGVSSSTFDTTPTFNWTNLSGFINGNIPAGATSYDIRIDQVLPTSVVTDFRTATVSVNSFTVPDNLALPTNNTYRFYVRARSADTQGDFSAKLEFFVGGRPVVNAVPTGSNQRPTLSWGAVDGASSYEIHLVNLADPSKIVARVGGIILNSFTPASNIGTGAFRLWVRAFNSANGSPSLWSVPVDFLVTENSRSQPIGTENNPWILTTASSVLENHLSEFSVSMLPSRSGSARSIEQEWADAAPVATADVSPEQVAGAAPAIPADSEVAEETDAVLSGWNQEAWWEDAQPVLPDATQSVVQVAAEPAAAKPEQKAASVGLLGSLLGLATLRRRRRDEES